MSSICSVSPDPVAAALKLLPWWVPYAGPALAAVVSFVGGTGLAYLVGRLLLWSTRDLADRHWTDQARRGWSVAYGVILAASLCAIVSSVFAKVLSGPFSAISYRATWCLALGGVVLPFSFFYWRTQRIVRADSQSLVASFRGAAATTLILGFTYVALAFLVGFAPRDGSHGWYVVLTLAVLAMCQADAGFFLARFFGLVRPAGQRSIGIVGKAAARAGVTAPRVFETVSQRPNAFALPMYGYMALSVGALAELSDDELVEISAHEIGHLKESWVAIVIRFVGLLPLALLVLPMETSYLLVALIAFLLYLRALHRFSARLEHRADRFAGESGESSAAYARAIEHLYRAALMPAVLGGTNSHPDLYDRMLAAGVEPDFPRPDPPPRSSGWWALTAPVALVALGLLVLVAILNQPLAWSHGRYLRLAVAGPKATSNLARSLARQGEHPIAILLLESLSATGRATQHSRLKLARTLAEAGCCARAADMVSTAGQHGAVGQEEIRRVWGTSDCENR
jgi:Zn-dependent protease with chaperone function